MSPFTLLSLSAESLRNRHTGEPAESPACGSRVERRWALWACAATVTAFVIVLAALG